MKKNVLFLIFLLIFVCSCGPSFSVRKQIKRNEQSLCKFPLTYKGNHKWEVFPDSIKKLGMTFDKKLNKWVDSYEPVKVIFHTYTSKNAFGVPSEYRSETIMYRDGKLQFK